MPPPFLYIGSDILPKSQKQQLEKYSVVATRYFVFFLQLMQHSKLLLSHLVKNLPSFRKTEKPNVPPFNSHRGYRQGKHQGVQKLRLSDIHHPDNHHLKTFITPYLKSDVHHLRGSSLKTGITSDILHLLDVHDPLTEFRHSSPQTFYLKSVIHHLRHFT